MNISIRALDETRENYITTVTTSILMWMKKLILGHYIYIETSAPRRPGDKARLTSPSYPAATNSECLQFYYHMYGIHIGTLNVRVSKHVGPVVQN